MLSTKLNNLAKLIKSLNSSSFGIFVICYHDSKKLLFFFFLNISKRHHIQGLTQVANRTNNLQLIMWQHHGMETQNASPCCLCKILSTRQVMSLLFPSSEAEQSLLQQAQTHNNPNSICCTDFLNKPRIKTAAKWKAGATEWQNRRDLLAEVQHKQHVVI